MSFDEKDTQTDMLLGEPKSAICVQRFDDSLNSAIHTTYRSWLRSSSMREPRDPPSKVVTLLFLYVRTYLSHCAQSLHQMCPLKNTVGAGAHREAHQPVARHGAPLLTELADP